MRPSFDDLMADHEAEDGLNGQDEESKGSDPRISYLNHPFKLTAIQKSLSVKTKTIKMCKGKEVGEMS